MDYNLLYKCSRGVDFLDIFRAGLVRVGLGRAYQIADTLFFHFFFTLIFSIANGVYVEESVFQCLFVYIIVFL